MIYWWVKFFSRGAVVVGTVCEKKVLLLTLDEQTYITQENWISTMAWTTHNLCNETVVLTWIELESEQVYWFVLWGVELKVLWSYLTFNDVYYFRIKIMYMLKSETWLCRERLTSWLRKVCCVRLENHGFKQVMLIRNRAILNEKHPPGKHNNTWERSCNIFSCVGHVCGHAHFVTC